MSNSLDPDQTGLFVWPDLGPNCLQRLSAGDTIKQRVNLSRLGFWKGELSKPMVKGYLLHWAAVKTGEPVQLYRVLAACTYKVWK